MTPRVLASHAPCTEAVAGSSTSILADAGATEKKIEKVETEMTGIKEELRAPKADTDVPFLRGRLLALEQQLAGLQMQLGALFQERLSQRQGAMLSLMTL